ncbi:MAG: signal peptidase I [Myxococcales bacterium]|nr:signal peptidase I [Myxococcales bacterium]
MDKQRSPGAGPDSKQRRLWVGRLLTCVLPGLGHLYLGHVRAASALAGCFLLGVLGFFAVCLAPGVVYLRPAGLFVLYYCILVLSSLFNLDSIYQKDLGAGNFSPRSPLVYFVMWIGVVGVPSTFLWWVAGQIWGTVTIADYGYFPQVVPGDKVLFRRAVETLPQRGDLFVVEDGNHSPTLGRIVGLPGEVIWIESDGGLVIDDVPVGKRLVGRVEVTDPVLNISYLAHLRAFRESGMAVPFETLVDTRTAMRPTDPVLLPDYCYYVLADNRTAVDAVDSRTFGVVCEDKIIGTPLYISLSSDPETWSIRWKRIGLMLR